MVNAEMPRDSDMETEKTPESSQALAASLLAGDATAPEEIFRRYVRRLTALARARLSSRVGRRVDPEDAVQSAFRSFFIGARTGRFTLDESGDLWRLLATITSRKVSRAAAHHGAAKRSVGKEVNLTSSSGFETSPMDHRLPSPVEAAALADELTNLMQSLPPMMRRMLQMRLQDVSLADIAKELDRTERTIRRWLNEVEVLLRRRLGSATLEPLQTPTTSDEGRARPAPAVAKPSFTSSIDYRDLVLESHLGSGGIGRVYRAFLRSRAQHVAVKVLRKRLQANPKAVERFLREASLVAALSHPAITRLHGIGRMPAGGYFFVMDLVEGGDLQQRIDSGVVPAAKIGDWLQQAAEAVAFAHAHGVVHCDLKPSNLLLDRNDRIVISDFGFAVALAESRRPVGGTPAYLAPELIDERWGEVSPATDVWGLGAVLFALLYRHPPWTQVTFERLIERLKCGDIKFPELPTSTFTEVCRRSLNIDAAQRFPSASAFAEAFRVSAADVIRRT
jgi:RNA polymerase sigma factor (sigma-70 family)